jgi:hypothetical protein
MRLRRFARGDPFRVTSTIGPEDLAGLRTAWGQEPAGLFQARAVVTLDGMHHARLRTAAALSLALVVAFGTQAAPPIASSFSTGAEGWTIADLNCSNYAQIVGGGTITWIESGGAPGGYIRSTDPTGNCYSFESPANFEGNRTDYIGGSLRWKIRTNVADWLPGSVFILIGAGNILVADVPQPTTGAWLDYSVTLTNTSFRLNNTSGAVPTPAQFAATMGALASVRISAEFGSEAGEETVDLDSVVLRTACPADLNGDGMVDASDLAILLGAWGSTTDITADLNGDSAIDASDLAFVLGAWGPCP